MLLLSSEAMVLLLQANCRCTTVCILCVWS